MSAAILRTISYVSYVCLYVISLSRCSDSRVDFGVMHLRIDPLDFRFSGMSFIVNPKYIV